MRKVSYILYFALAVLGCTRLSDDTSIYELGPVNPEISVGYEGGECGTKVLSNGDFTVSIPDDADWLHFKSSSGRTMKLSGDATISFTVDINRSVPRKAEVVMRRGNNTALLTIRQSGLLQGGFELLQQGVSVEYEGGECGARVNTLLKDSDLTYRVAYEQDEELSWISHIRLEGNFIRFSVAANLSSTLLRHAQIEIRYESGSAVILVTQFCQGTAVVTGPMADFKALLDHDGVITLNEHYLLEGVVVNDPASPNGAENRIISVDIPDMEYKSRIIYLQDPDGLGGMKVEFQESCKGLLNRWSRISVDAYGLTLVRESNPLRYCLREVPHSAIVSSESGSALTPRTVDIADIVAEDLFTFVTIPDVEIPVRKGPYMPIDIRYISVMTAYPMVLRDGAGSQLPMMVNIDAPWSRDGDVMPRGRGSVSGVLVHETCDNFEWDAEREDALRAAGAMPDYISGLGEFSPWQIRPMEKADIAISEDFDKRLSEVLYEWAYCDSLGVNLVKNYNPGTDELFPTYPLSENPLGLDAKLYCAKSSGVKVKLGLCNDFTHLGPYTYGGVIATPSNGNGVVDALGRSAHWRVYPSVPTIGVIYSGSDWSQSNGAAWTASGWSTSQWWCAEFPTQELAAAQGPVSVVFGTLNAINGPGAPRHWKVEFSQDGTEWSVVGSYTVPDFVQAASKKAYQLPGAKYLMVNLPESVKSAEKAYVRLIPADKVAGTADSYEGGAISSSRYNALNYFSIRYTK